MNAAVRRLRTDGKAVAAERASTGILGSLLLKRIIKARAVKGSGKQYGYARVET